jgi:GTP1/Obg family GTP-binding protein
LIFSGFEKRNEKLEKFRNKTNRKKNQRQETKRNKTKKFEKRYEKLLFLIPGFSHLHEFFKEFSMNCVDFFLFSGTVADF